jgi:hypothetical protein
MQISQTKEQIKALSAFQNHCEIESITLQSCTAIRAKAGTEFREPFSVKPVLSNISSFLQGDRFIVEVSFEYAAWDSSEPPERIFLVNSTFEAAYQIRDGYLPSDEEKSSFSRGTAVFNCWPYAREFLRDITSRLGHQTPAIPLLRIIPKKAEKKAEMPITAPIEVAPGHAALPATTEASGEKRSVHEKRSQQS